MKNCSAIQWFWCFIAFILSTQANAQSNLDSNVIFTADEFIQVVKSFHPIVKQAALNVQMAKAAKLSARGAFDPSIYINSDQKTFDGKNYYTYTNPELKIPTWYGIEVKAGLENNGGLFLNDEVSAGKTSYLGVSVPVAKNLTMDRRRAVLKQASLFVQQSDAERLNTINDILYDAYVAYYEWANRFQQYEIISTAVAVNQARFNLVKIGYRQGDRPAIDTVEALAQLQNFQFLQSEALVKFANAGVDLSNFLWLENDQPFTLPNTTIPEVFANASLNNVVPLLDELLLNAKLSHPKLAMTNFKIKSLTVEKQLKFQSLLPMVNLKANLLNKGYNVFKGANAAFFQQNNKFGIDIGMPLRLSEGRGEYRRAKLKIKDAGYDLSLQQVQIANKVRYYYNEMTALRNQVNIMEAALKNYQTLLRGETTRFNSGESTLFVLNSRENKVLETQQKLVELQNKYSKSLVAMQWAAGQLR
ncbi:MAG: TolC family protein [Ferruginibacter sp.]